MLGKVLEKVLGKRLGKVLGKFGGLAGESWGVLGETGGSFQKKAHFHGRLPGLAP